MIYVLSCTFKKDYTYIIEEPTQGGYCIVELGEINKQCDLCQSDSVYFLTNNRIISCKNVNMCALSGEIFGKKNNLFYPIYHFRQYPRKVNNVDSLYIAIYRVGNIEVSGKNFGFEYIYLEHLKNLLKEKDPGVIDKPFDNRIEYNILDSNIINQIKTIYINK
jgi:hypothetical protein